MTAQRRRRNGVTGRKRQKQAPQQQQSQSNSEDSSDGGSVTRCVCGKIHNLGLMVQCDKCEVWQHCECVGLAEQDMPEHYYCEKCKPQYHSMVRLTHGRTRSSYSAAGVSDSDKKAPKKRMTLNSREASMSLEDVLAARNALEMASSSHEPAAGSAPASPKDIDAADSDTKIVKRLKDENTSESMDGDITTHMKSAASSDSHEDQNNVVSDEKATEAETNKAAPKQKRATNGKVKTEESKGSEQTGSINGKSGKGVEKRGRNGATGRRLNSANGRRGQSNKPRSRTSTPQPAESAPSVADCGASIIEKLSPMARESSPPAKIRYPSSRMTISEMNRRAKQILEYISSMQVEMASKDSSSNDNKGTCAAPDKTPISTEPMETCSQVIHKDPNSKHAHDDKTPNRDATTSGVKKGKPKTKPAAIEIPEKTDQDSPSSSLSSASTIPLEESRMDDDQEMGTAEEVLERIKVDGLARPQTELTSLELMDMLTRELIKFQNRFGPIANQLQMSRSQKQNVPTSDEVGNDSENRTTRLREAGFAA